ncbi:sigma-54-dependent Fis family transcriptional regulator [Pelagicoccus sp. NFK12]|uniref:Sigma-54-dependent Fis family transcriptional regulator n=1 Tax=Pelagicoccus enzymogenes TaxID=2773457 RepID=A0A927F7B2_9BACT|nr:sigma-54 dependent transcriptional regulator [Pelagicoccus enzymogenes]MBD5778278.1 sigma-54-dependent Fis family transcriptional regulator [Pelagicoccus enzymogenes]
MPRTAKLPSILAADDDVVVQRLVAHSFEAAGLYVTVYESGKALLDNVNEDTLVCLVDMVMPEVSGMDCLRAIKKKFPNTEVVILTNVNDASNAIEAMRQGAFDYLTKPFDPDELCLSVRKAMQLAKASRENEGLREAVNSAPSLGSSPLVGDAPSIARILKIGNRIAKSKNSVLINGESGTGKGVMARYLHSISDRADKPFITVSCPSLPKDLLESEMFGHEKGAFSGAIQKRLGKVELAHGGTLFLDEIGEMSLDLQPKLLSFIQERTFYRVGGEKQHEADVRIIAATNRDLQQMSQDGGFREDLYFRLNVLPITMPPLRERPGDTLLLAQHFLKRAAKREASPAPSLSVEAAQALQAHDWPGNVRELENVIERAFTLREEEDSIQGEDLPAELRAAKSQASTATPSLAGKTLSEIEKIAIEQTLEHCKGNKAESARMLGISEKSIYNKMKRFQSGS